GPMPWHQNPAAHSGVGQPLGRDRARRSRTNDQCIGGLIAGGHTSFRSRYNTLAMSLPRYDTQETYRWNYDRAPEPPPGIEIPRLGGRWTYCGRPVRSPLAIAAGPLLNGRWILYYAALGFDVLTYKTVRSGSRDCYPLPNLQPVESESLDASGNRGHANDPTQEDWVLANEPMQGSWAVSFGMPSMSPDVWRADVERTRCALAKEKLLSVS